MADVNQLWDVDEAIEYMKKLADLKLWYVDALVVSCQRKKLTGRIGSLRSLPLQMTSSATLRSERL
jgi:hypothetical protein